MNVTAAAQWTVSLPSRWSLRSWDGDGGVIFDDALGAYHALTASAFNVLCAALSLRLFTVAELVQLLMGDDSLKGDTELVALCLMELKSLGVVDCFGV